MMKQVVCVVKVENRESAVRDGVTARHLFGFVRRRKGRGIIVQPQICLSERAPYIRITWICGASLFEILARVHQIAALEGYEALLQQNRGLLWISEKQQQGEEQLPHYKSIHRSPELEHQSQLEVDVPLASRARTSDLAEVAAVLV